MAEREKPSSAGRSPADARLLRAGQWIERIKSAASRLSPERTGLWLAGAAAILGFGVALSTLGRGAWLDEFWTLASTVPEQSPDRFLGVMARDVHPLLHYGLIYVARSLGLEQLTALRALNVLGVPMVGWALWLAYRRGALVAGQMSVLIAIYASSAMSLLYFAELRAYFLVYSSAIAVALVWRVLARTAADGGAWSAGLLAAWGASLAVFVNLHYFATLLGGLLTLALLVGQRGRGVLPVAGVSLLAAAPAVATALAQSFSVDAGIVSWVQSGRIDAAFMMVDSAWKAAAYNVVAVGCAGAATLIAAERCASVKTFRDEIALAGVMAAYVAILLAINLIRPIVVDRYLVAGGGPIVLLVALLAGGAGAPRWGPAAACVFALTVQARGLYTKVYASEGWAASAAYVADMVRACPESRVLIDPTGGLPSPAMYVVTMRYGLQYYAAQLDFPIVELGPGDRVESSGRCPSLVWLEHDLPDGTVSGSEVLARLRLRVDGDADLLRVGSGIVIVVK